MIPVKVEALMVGVATNKSVVVLRPWMDNSSTPRVLPIYISTPETMSLSTVVENKPCCRPQTHDLLISMVKELDGHILRVIIDRVEGLTFCACVVVEKDGKVIEVDARPSDAIALALRADVNIYVEAPVFEVASIPFNPVRDNLQDREMEAFRDYVDSLNPEDFIGNSDENS